MKRNLLLFLLVLASIETAETAFAQRQAIGIVTFETTGSGVTAKDAADLTNKIIDELNSWGTINAVQGESGADYIIKGTLSKQSGNFVLSAKTSDAGGKILNEYKEQARTINDMPAYLLCVRAVEKVPLPNYLLGTWQSTINMPDGPVVCIIEFKADKSVRVERYDTWEHKQNNSLRYEGYGTGSYSCICFVNKVVNVSGRQVSVDAMFNVNLRLEETLPAQTSVSQGGLRLVFNGDRASFEIENGILPCGRNFDGPSVYSSAVLGFSQFRKIR